MPSDDKKFTGGLKMWNVKAHKISAISFLCLLYTNTTPSYENAMGAHKI